ncbi:histone-lysine N-methyltransferase 2D-like [Eriocheir sinensis]|uniref:histone-lysine N-methyltransferase 2D-like n=1 Tax=Eriocheir sinensis TaxID=95602 RepID=UPI0021C9F6FC|nr:histone-lysine N-methyltransferase 2D-like [Eriocheir sinensis]
MNQQRMGTRRQPRTHFLSLRVIENVDEVLLVMGDLGVWPCIFTLSLASVLQEDTFGHLELCCMENKLCAANMACIGCLCRCPLTYDYKSSSGRCEPQFVPTTTATNTSANASGLGGGKLPGEECFNSSACVEGLPCVKHKCQCPEPCVYLSEELVCDCGNADDVVWPAVVGVGVGFVIVAFWGMCITSSVRSHMEERNKVMQLGQQQQIPRISTLGAAYGNHLAPPRPDQAQVYPAPPARPEPSAPALTSMPTPAPAPLRLTGQTAAPTPPPPLQPVFRPPSPPTSTYHFNPSYSPSSPYLTPPDPPFPYLTPEPTEPLLPPPPPYSAPQDRRRPPLLLDPPPPDAPLPPPWVDVAPRSARF